MSLNRYELHAIAEEVGSLPGGSSSRLLSSLVKQITYQLISKLLILTCAKQNSVLIIFTTAPYLSVSYSSPCACHFALQKELLSSQLLFAGPCSRPRQWVFLDGCNEQALTRWHLGPCLFMLWNMASKSASCFKPRLEDSQKPMCRVGSMCDVAGSSYLPYLWAWAALPLWGWCGFR